MAQAAEPPAAQTQPAEPCGARLDRFIQGLIEQADGAKPANPAQQRALEAARNAAVKARDMVREACANERTAASVRELEAAEKQMMAALEALGPALEKFYGSLTEEQKGKLKSFGRDFEAWASDLWRELAQSFDLRADPNERARDHFRFCVEGYCFSMPQRGAPERKLEPYEERL
jgi:hypothetical protein